MSGVKPELAFQAEEGQPTELSLLLKWYYTAVHLGPCWLLQFETIQSPLLLVTRCCMLCNHAHMQGRTLPGQAPPPAGPEILPMHNLAWPHEHSGSSYLSECARCPAMPWRLQSLVERSF